MKINQILLGFMLLTVLVLIIKEIHIEDSEELTSLVNVEIIGKTYIFKDLNKSLSVSGCVSYPKILNGIRICTREEALHRGWVYDRDQIERRVKERKNR